MSGLPESVEGLEPGARVTGGVFRQDLYHNGGEWLNGVFRTGQGECEHCRDHDSILIQEGDSLALCMPRTTIGLR